MAEIFRARRDSSSNNVPVVGYNDGVDAQDVILFSACKVTETLTSDGTGLVTLSNYPVSISADVYSDMDGVKRARNLNDDFVITSIDGDTTYYAGAVSPTEKTLKVYVDENRTATTTGATVKVSYYKKVPVKVNENGELYMKEAGTKNVNVTNQTLGVSIKSSEVPFVPREKVPAMLKKEGSIAAGASATELAMTVGDGTKDMYITNILCYYNGTGEETDGYVSFWFDYINDGGTSVGTMDLIMSPKAKGMTQVDFGEYGFVLPAGKTLRFRVGSSWTQNTIHVLAFGWQYGE